MLWSSDDALAQQTKERIAGNQSWVALPPDDKDKEALSDGAMDRILRAEIREHFRQSFWTYTEDGKILAGELGSDLKDVQAECVRLWYGKRDLNVPAAIGEDNTSRLGSKAKLRVKDETHLSLVKNFAGEVIKELINDS